MDQEFGDDLITITDEDGVEYELEILARLEYEGSDYIALAPAETDESEEVEVVIFKIVEEDGEEVFEALDDEALIENVFNAFIELSYEDDEDGSEEE